jgi:DNA-binding response OmpR family regulator
MDLTVSLEENCVIWKGVRANLTPAEAEIMQMFVAADGLLSCDGLMRGLHGNVRDLPGDNSIRVHISNLRRKLRAADIPITIVPVFNGKKWDRGWRLVHGY